MNPLTVYDFKVKQGTKQVGLNIHMKEAIIYGLPDAVFEAARLATLREGHSLLAYPAVIFRDLLTSPTQRRQARAGASRGNKITCR